MHSICCVWSCCQASSSELPTCRPRTDRLERLVAPHRKHHPSITCNHLYQSTAKLSTLLLRTDKEYAITMFYQGDLQSGIATAMREAKPVVCFIRGMSLIVSSFKLHICILTRDLCTDDQEESTTWEDEYFNSEEVILF